MLRPGGSLADDRGDPESCGARPGWPRVEKEEGGDPARGSDGDGKVSANGLKSPSSGAEHLGRLADPGEPNRTKGGLLMKKVYVRIALIASGAVALLLAGGAGHRF
jgi:hypothetical protein